MLTQYQSEFQAPLNALSELLDESPKRAANRLRCLVRLEFR